MVLLGRNGVGKSQMIQLLRRAVSRSVPGLQVSPSVVLGYTDQGMAHLPDDQTPHCFVAAHPNSGDARTTACSPAPVSLLTRKQVRSGGCRRVRRRDLACSRSASQRRVSICWTSPQTTSIFLARSSSRRSCWRSMRPAFWCRTTAVSSKPWRPGSCGSTKAKSRKKTARLTKCPAARMHRGLAHV